MRCGLLGARGSARVDRLVAQRGPHAGDHLPDYPPQFPFPFQIKQPLHEGSLYLVYQGTVHAYGRIARVAWHTGSHVGTFAQRVSPGDAIVLAGPTVPFPYALPCRGFVGIRYTLQNLHELPLEAACQVIWHLKLAPS
jgi:hypothetical protein